MKVYQLTEARAVLRKGERWQIHDCRPFQVKATNFAVAMYRMAAVVSREYQLRGLSRTHGRMVALRIRVEEKD